MNISYEDVASNMRFDRQNLWPSIDTDVVVRMTPVDFFMFNISKV